MKPSRVVVVMGALLVLAMVEPVARAAHEPQLRPRLPLPKTPVAEQTSTAEARALGDSALARIMVKFQDAAGHAHILRCNGLLARCVQHEVDHLNGVLYIDRMEKDVVATIEPELKALKKATREAIKK